MILAWFWNANQTDNGTAVYMFVVLLLLYFGGWEDDLNVLYTTLYPFSYQGVRKYLKQFSILSNSKEEVLTWRVLHFYLWLDLVKGDQGEKKKWYFQNSGWRDRVLSWEVLEGKGNTLEKFWTWDSSSNWFKWIIWVQPRTTFSWITKDRGIDQKEF